VRLPATTTPWATLHFVGGAGLGVAPQICYASLLAGVCERAGVMVIATPYELATDHTRLARGVAKAFDACFLTCSLDGLAPPASAPVFRLGHSLGAKLLTIASCLSDRTEDALGLLALNNFGVAESAAFSAKIIAALQGGERGARTGEQVASVISLLQSISVATGNAVEFTPSPQELREMVQSSHTARNTMLWRFDADDLDCSDALLPAFPPAASVDVTVLRGSHLSPVAFTIAPTEIDPILGALLGAQGVQTLSLGDEAVIESIVESVVSWLWPRELKAPRVLAPAASEEAE